MPFTALQRQLVSAQRLHLCRYRTSHAVYGIAKLNIDDKSPCGADPRGLSYTRFHGNFAMMECAHPAIL